MSLPLYKSHRVLICVESINDNQIELRIPSWKNKTIEINKNSLGEFKDIIKVNDYLLGYVNLNAENSDDLFIKITEILDNIDEEIKIMEDIINGTR